VSGTNDFVVAHRARSSMSLTHGVVRANGRKSRRGGRHVHPTRPGHHRVLGWSRLPMGITGRAPAAGGRAFHTSTPTGPRAPRGSPPRRRL